MLRRQLPVAPPLSPRALLDAARHAGDDPAELHAAARQALAARTGAAAVTLTDSGTSALVLALRLTAGRGGTVAYPGYACVDLAAAARFAGVRVRLYDLDPVTLSPDLDSLAATLRRGVDAVVVAHLYGYPADVRGVRALASSFGVPVIEDAAQGAGARLHGTITGGLAELAVLSFGRGKGLCAGGGGALLAMDRTWAGMVRLAQPGAPILGDGRRELVRTAAQWAFGRPGLYFIPSMIPGLRLGEMVYHPAHEPAALSGSAARLLGVALALEPADLACRRAIAARLAQRTGDAHAVAGIAPLDGAEPGFLRFAVRDLSGVRDPLPRLGILRGYPRTLHEQPELRPLLRDGEPRTPGSATLRHSLFTLPTHRFVRPRDLDAIAAWLAWPHRRGPRRQRRTGGLTPQVVRGGDHDCGSVATGARAAQGAAS